MDCSFATGGANTITRKTNIGGFGPAVLVALYLLWAPTDPPDIESFTQLILNSVVTSKIGHNEEIVCCMITDYIHCIC